MNFIDLLASCAGVVALVEAACSGVGLVSAASGRTGPKRLA
jgi:hypothetical protein